MVTGVLFLALVLLTLLLTAFIYQIVMTPITPVDAPTLIRSAAAAAPAPAPALPVRRPRASTVPAAARPGHRISRRGASRRLQSWGAAAFAIAGVAAVIIGGSLFLRIAHGATACSHQTIQVCSQGYVLLTGTQLSGCAIAGAGIISVVIAIVLAMR